MNLILKNARVVSMSSGADGYQPSSPQDIVIESGKIVSISCSNQGVLASELEQVSVDGSLDYITYDCKNKLVTPGLIDCHTHLVFAGNRANEFEQRLNGVSY
ncbi:imidazolonepropionase, partial [Vibrio splendidus]